VIRLRTTDAALEVHLGLGIASAPTLIIKSNYVCSPAWRALEVVP
jgi:hypothetical protein